MIRSMFATCLLTWSVSAAQAQYLGAGSNPNNHGVSGYTRSNEDSRANRIKLRVIGVVKTVPQDGADAVQFSLDEAHLVSFFAQARRRPQLGYAQFKLGHRAICLAEHLPTL